MDILINHLPKSSCNKIGFPWTEGTPPQYFAQNLPKISIITPSFNQGLYIEETIRSVLLQGYSNLEYIIIDGGSTDNTIEIIKKYEKWITYWVSEPDEGQSDAINKGIKIATGDVFNWLNSDDYYMPNALLTVGKAFMDDEKLDVFCARERQISESGINITTEGTIVCSSLEETIAKAYNNQPPTFFKLAVVKQLGGLCKDLYFCMDAELWVNYLVNFESNGHVKKNDFIVNIFRIHHQAKSSKDKFIYYKDRFNILFALAKSVTEVEFPLDILEKNELINHNFNRTYRLNSVIKQKELAAFIADQLIHYHCQNFNWIPFFRLYFFSIFNKPYNRNLRFYISPLIKFKRIFRPL